MVIPQKSKNKLLSLIIPAYKQEKTIKRDLLRISAAMDKLQYRYEIIVAVDGELDNTFKIAKTLTSRKLKVVGYKNNHGKGYAVRYGMTHAKGNIIAFIDAGMDINPKGLEVLLDYFVKHTADIVIGSKLHPKSKVTYPWQRKLLSWGYRTLVRILFGLCVRDTQVGMKLFKRQALEKVFPRLLVKRYAFDIEILAVANHLGYTKIYEAPIELNFSAWSSITSTTFIHTVGLMMWDTLAVFYRLRILHYYDDKSQRKWLYDPELNFRVNVG